MYIHYWCWNYPSQPHFHYWKNKYAIYSEVEIAQLFRCCNPQHGQVWAINLNIDKQNNQN